MLKAAGSLLALLAVPLLTPLHGKNILIFPYSTQSSSVVVYNAEPVLGSSASATLTAQAGPQYAAMDALASKYYIGSSGASSGTVTVLNATSGAQTKQFSFASPITFLEMAPDGRRLVVFAGTLHIIDSNTDVEVTPSGMPDLETPLTDGVRITPDGARVLILSATKLSAFDLIGNAAVSASLPFGATVNALSVSPWCKAYVSAQGAIYEIEPSTLAIENTFTLTGLPGAVAFSPDGAQLIAPNTTPATGAAIFVIDRTSKTVTSGLNFQVVFDKLIPLSNGHLLAFSSNTQTIYDILTASLALNSTNPTITWGNVSFSGQVRAILASDEVPSKYLYVLNSSVLYQIDPIAGAVISQVPVSVAQASRMAFVGAANQASVVDFTLYNSGLTVATSGTALPLIVRAVDTNGKPVYNASASFVSASPLLVLQTTSATTNTKGYARALIATLPPTVGTFTISAQIGVLSKNFTITVGTGSGSGGSTGGGTGGVGSPGLNIYSGQGQVLPQTHGTYEPGYDPLGVQLRDASGNVVSGATVTWTTTQGNGIITGLPGITDSNGVSQVNFYANVISDITGVRPETITASYGTQSVTFNLTVLGFTPGGNFDPMGLAMRLITPTSKRLSGQAGTTAVGAIQLLVTTSYGSPNIPNVALTLVNSGTASTTPTATCVGGTVYSDASGVATCDVVYGGTTGDAQLTLRLGGYVTYSDYALHVDPGPPTQIVPISSSTLSGTPGQTLTAMTIEVRDGGGNPLPNVPLTWTVVTPGTVTLTNAFTMTNSQGRASATPTLGSIPGNAQVKVTAGTAGTASFIFTLSVNVQLSGLIYMSGNNQSAVVNNAFGAPLIVKALNTQQVPVAGLAISWAVTSGSGALGAGTSTTDANGFATMTAQAGGSPGPLIITASVTGAAPVTFNLTVAPLGPSFSASNVVNAASGQQGVTPGGLATITGTNLAINVTGGAVVANNGFPGKWPTTLSGVQVTFGSYPAPIYWVSNSGGVQSVTVQVPFEVPVGTTSVSINVAGGSTTVPGIVVKPIQPGLFETYDANNQKVAILTRPDGSYVSTSNPAVRGEILRMFVTGLGQTTPATGTNEVGIPKQSVAASLIAGVKAEGATVTSSEYATGTIGLYIVSFQLPTDISAGTNVPISIAAQRPDGNYEGSNTSVIPAII